MLWPGKEKVDTQRWKESRRLNRSDLFLLTRTHNTAVIRGRIRFDSANCCGLLVRVTGANSLYLTSQALMTTIKRYSSVLTCRQEKIKKSLEHYTIANTTPRSELADDTPQAVSSTSIFFFAFLCLLSRGLIGRYINAVGEPKRLSLSLSGRALRCASLPLNPCSCWRHFKWF